MSHRTCFLFQRSTVISGPPSPLPAIMAPGNITLVEGIIKILNYPIHDPDITIAAPFTTVTAKVLIQYHQMVIVFESRRRRITDLKNQQDVLAVILAEPPSHPPIINGKLVYVRCKTPLT